MTIHLYICPFQLYTLSFNIIISFLNRDFKFQASTIKNGSQALLGYQGDCTTDTWLTRSVLQHKGQRIQCYSGLVVPVPIKASAMV